MARGNRRENIFHDEDDRTFFLKTLAEACAMTGWRVHAWALLSNHYHIFLQTPEANLVAGMKWLQNTYTRRFNVRHKQWGRLFGDRYKAVLVEGSTGYYYETLLDYIHLNPVRAGLVDCRQGQSLRDHPWSSVVDYCKREEERPKWLAAREGLEAFGFQDDVEGRRQWLLRLEGRASKEDAVKCGMTLVEAEGLVDKRRDGLSEGWYWGTQAFAEKLLKMAESLLSRSRHRGYHSSLEQQAHGLDTAQKLLEKGLAEAGLEAEQLGSLPGSDPRKVAIAEVIRAQTTMDLAWIAEHLEMKSAANVSQQLLRMKKLKT